MIMLVGKKQWYKNGKLHRDGNLPAVEYENGDMAYYIDGIYNRTDNGPTIICNNPYIRCYHKNGVLIIKDAHHPDFLPSGGIVTWRAN